ncbi:MAG: glycosyltransferase [Verrucomicrobia bacterium]|nr:MAG: glycosyltransferase [Verrucomicrobiota bacterium]
MSERSDVRAPLSVLVPVKNEATNLRDCLASVAFARETVVVDSGSTDGTQAIARSAGAQVVQFAWNGKFPRKKNWALENIPWHNEWVLIVDADERVTPELEREIRGAIRRTDVDGFYLNRRFWFLDGWINHCGYFPSWNLRLFRHRLGRYEQIDIDDVLSGDNEVHEHVLLNGRTEYLSAPMEHYAFPDAATFVEKHNRYSTWEAAAFVRLHQRPNEKTLRATPFGTALERKRWLRKLAMSTPFRPSLRFLYHYIWKQGFRDGYRGWVLCRLLAWYERLIVLKQREMKAGASG